MPPYFRRLVFLIAFVLVGHSQALSAQTATTTSLSLLSGSAPVLSAPARTVITLRADVTGGASPITGGTIYFCDSIVKNCSLMPTGTTQVVNGSAIFKTVLPPGSYSFTAVYVPAVGFSASTSSASTLSITTSSPSTATLTNSSSAGGTYWLSATLAGQTLIRPTGTITINDKTAGIVLGSGTLAPPPSYGYVGPGSITLNETSQLPGDSNGACATVTGDFNGDGHPDIAIGSDCQGLNNSANALQILLSNGDGTFTAGPAVPAAMTNTRISALTVGDFNNDGTLDLIAVTGANVYLLANDGTGTFTASQISTTSAFGCYASELVTADFNRDGNLDFFGCGMFLGDGTGSFNQSQVSINGYGSGQNQFAVADFDGDSYPDIGAIIGGGEFDQLAIFINSGNGKDFTATLGDFVRFPLGVFAGDFDNDGKADLIGFGLQYYSGTQAPGTFIFPFTSGGATVGGALPTATGGTSISTGDFNHDGTTDYAFVTSGSITVGLGGVSNGTSVSASLPDTSASNYFPSAIADLDGDGLPDILASNNSQSYATIHTVGGGSSAYLTNTRIDIPGSGSHVVSADYSGDAVYAASTSNSLNLNAGIISTSVSLTATPSPSSVGTQVTVTATVSPYSVGNYTTNGDIITFKNGATVLGTAALNNGIAVLNVTNLPIGQNQITATFPGDTNFSSSTSSAATVTVTAIPAPTVNPTSIDFGSIDYTTTASRTVTLTNTATGPLNITSIQLSIGFTQTNNCGSSLAGAASCTITLTFAPTAPGSATGTLTVNTNAATPTATVALSATGLVYPTVQLTTSANSAVIGTSVTFTATITPATVGSSTANGGYVYFSSGSTTFTPVVVANGQAVFTTQNLPAGSNVVSASFSGGSNNYAGANSNNVSVAVTNISPPSVSPTSVSFGVVGIGSSVAQTVTFTNVDTASPLNITSIQVSNGFTQTNNCGSSLASAASCTVTLTFAPLAAAPLTGTLTFTTNANTPTRTVALSGTGVVPALQLTGSPGSAPIGAPLTFTAMLTPYSAGSLSTNGKTVSFSNGSTQLGTATLNNGVAALNVTSLPLGSDSVIATFAGDANFASVTSNSATVTITAPPAPTVSPTSVNFSATHQGFSTTQTVSLTNTSAGPLTIASIVATGSGFTQTNNCGSSLTAAASCTVTVTFAPTAAGTTTGSLAITTNASSPITTVALNGSGIAPVLYLTASPTSTPIGTQVALTATLTPYINGGLTTNGRTVAFTSGSTTLGTAILNNGTALLNLTNLPIGSNSIVATFTGDANFPTATSSPVVITITGPTAPTVTPSSINFGTVTLGNSVSQTVTLTNTAATPLTITAVQASGGFTQTNTCGNLAVSASCTATVTFAPTTAGAATGTLTFTTTAVNATTTVNLSGSGVAAISPGGSSGSLGTIKAGTNATLPISFTTAAGVSGTLTTTCTVKMTNGGTASNPPTCSASPGTFTVSGGSTVTTTLTITTTGSSAALHMPATGTLLAGGLLGLLAFFRRRPAIASLLVLLLSLTTMTMITGCAGGGGGSSSSGGGGNSGGTTPTPSTTAGAYTVTVTATIGTQTSRVDLPLTIQ